MYFMVLGFYLGKILVICKFFLVILLIILNDFYFFMIRSIFVLLDNYVL